LRHIVGRVFIVVLVLAQPVELRVTPALELMAEDVIFALLGLSADGHLLLALMGTIWNGSTLFVVLDA